MLSRLLLLSALALATGCVGLVRPDDLRPPPHPLLEGWMRPTHGGVQRGRPGLANGRAIDAAARQRVRRALDAVTGRTDLDEAGLASEVSAALRLTDRDALTSPARAIAPARAAPGDRVRFARAPHVPTAGWVRRRLPGGTLEVVTITRGAARRILVDPRHPDERRRGGRVVNTFLRPRSPDDAAGARYLAGQLWIGVERLAQR